MKRLLIVFIIIMAFFAGCSESMKYGKPPYDYPTDYSGATKSNAENLVKLINNNDTRGLKAMFAKTSQEELFFDVHLSKLSSFIDGKITTHSKITTSISRDSDGKGYTHISPTVYISNIKTSTGKKYDIYYTSRLFSLNNDSEEGIWTLTVTNQETNETLTIGQDAANG